MPYIELEQKSRAVGPGVLTIGSGTEASWRIQGRDLAPLHAIIVPESEGRTSIVQGGPGARILVNGCELDSGWRFLESGDELRLGDIVGKFNDVSRQNSGDNAAFLRDTRRGRLYRVGDYNEIGRDLRCSVLIQEPEVSRIHAEVRANSGAFVLKPRAGVTLINGHRVTEPTSLKEGDELIIGRTHLRFSHEVPMQTVVAEGAPRHADERAAKMQTTFIGTIAMRDQLEKGSRRRFGKIALTVIAAAILIAGLIAFYGAAPRPATGTRLSDAVTAAPSAHQ